MPDPINFDSNAHAAENHPMARGNADLIAAIKENTATMQKLIQMLDRQNPPPDKTEQPHEGENKSHD